MMKDDNEPPSTEELRDDPLLFMNTFFFEGNPTHKNNHFQNMFMEVQDKIHKAMAVPPQFMGVDWAKDSGMNLGDVISRNNNVIEVRFKTVTIN